jgi:hypothetical protein
MRRIAGGMSPAAPGCPAQEPRRVSTPIAEDFAAIRARLEAIQTARTPAPAARDDRVPAPAGPSAPVDFYGWLIGGGLWASG